MENKPIYEILDHIERLKENIENYGLTKNKRSLHFAKFEMNNIKRRIEELEKDGTQ